MIARSNTITLLGCLAVVASALGSGCSESPEAATPSYGRRGRVGSTQGGAIVLSHDERVAVATHRTSGIVTVLHLDEAFGPEIALEIDVGVEARPWAAVIGADDDSAYVLLRGEQRVVRVLGLHSSSPSLDRQTWPTGAEPTAIAITPTGARVYVANWSEGTISTFRTSSDELDEATDLNVELARTGVLGPLTEIWDERELGSVRPGLAHPRALAMTDDGDLDDGDETLYATEFFSQPLLDSTESDPDRSRQGFVYAIDVGTGRPVVDPETGNPPGPISLSALDTGFLDAEDSATSCFPNQLLAAAVEGERLFVTSMCASPRGPLGAGPPPDSSPANFMTVVHPVIFVVDTALNREVTEAAAVLTRRMVDAYPDVENLRMPLIPNDIAVVPAAQDSGNGPRVYVTALGADAVFSVDYAADGTPAGIGQQSAPFIDLRPGGGRLPIGIALTRSAAEPAALVLTDHADAISVIDRADASVKRDAIVSPEALAGRVDQDVRSGRRLFATGLDNWSLKGQAWSSCESCHPEGLSDGVVWRFSRGPRRTLSTANTYYDDVEHLNRRILLWTANVDEIHDVEVIARTVSGAAGGVSWKAYQDPPNVDCRLLYNGDERRTAGGSENCPHQMTTSLRHDGLNGSLAALTKPEGTAACNPEVATCDLNALSDWDQIDAFIRALEVPRAPTTLNDDHTAAGAELFKARGCAVCHGGPGWTVSRLFYEPSELSNGAVPYTRPAADAGVDLELVRGALRIDSYTLPEGFRLLNQPLASSTTGLATFRSWPNPASEAAELDHLYGRADQINCVLRSVGTFPVQPEPPNPQRNFAAIAPAGAPSAEESRRVLDGQPPAYADLLAVGETGFNPPSLAGLALGAPYFHGGNARTLEELFDKTFALHHSNPAIGPYARAVLDTPELTPENVRDLVSYLLSIDEETEPVPILTATYGNGVTVNPDLCAQFEP